ncbi:MAG TPA: UDP-N-acetylmuramoyl-tripeptide--D-alanyl-D-alanine ligase [Actinomycetes bacterium]|nr:UDP-N-acetylmuramoyl-tripeptide--D-alanyl-D-alanine ligase [Actinomycetes bacterium]
MIPSTLEHLAAVTGGVVHDGDPGTVVTGPVVVDSRAAEPGSLFVAMRGDRVDGHDFAQAAMAAGAVAALATRPVAVPAVVVADPLAALGALARDLLDRRPAVTVTALTGSSGKTTTKDLLAQVLASTVPGAADATVATVASQNNELGLPLTVLTCDESTRHLVVEMGARGAGHIDYLASIARPHVAVVLNVGSAHLGEFGSRQAIAAAKGELVAALRPDGLAVLNGDDPLVRAMAERTQARVVLVGESERCQVRADDVRVDEQGRAGFTLVTPQGSAAVALRVYGEHHVANALAVAAVALEHGAELPAVAAALSQAEPSSRWRMEVRQRADGLTVVNDAYNANPESMRAALKALAAMAGGRRTWAVLGEMLELGPDSGTEHDAVGRLAVRLNVSRVVAVGDGARLLHMGASLEGSWDNESVWVPDIETALDLLEAEVRPDDVVLVKASRAIGLERVAAALLGEHAGAAS